MRSLAGLMGLALLYGAATTAAARVQAKPVRIGNRTLVIAGKASIKDSHSKFLAQLKEDFEVTFNTIDERVQLESYGEPQFDNIVLLAPSASSFGDLDADQLAAFVDNGGNLLVAGGPDVSSALRGLAHNFGVDYDAPKGRVVDHLSYHVSDAGKHTRVLSNAYFPSRYVVGAGLAGPTNGRAPPSVVYEGVALTVAPDNILAVRTLSLSPTGYSALLSAPIGSYPLAAGKEALLVASVQARNNARATFTGSLWFLSDEAWELGPELANARLSRAVARWTFQRSGVLTASNLRHAHADGSPPEHQVEHTEQRDLPVSMFPEPEIARQSLVYRIKDNVTFAVDLRVSDENGVVVPYTADDVQLEFVMLDPYIRTGLPHDGRGKFAVTFTVPDVYGIFHFRVAYRRPGVSALLLREQVSVRPFRHNEYERFISSAYPYYTAAFAMMAGAFIYAAFFLYSPAGAPVVAAAKAAAGAAAGAGQAGAAGTGAGDSKKQK